MTSERSPTRIRSKYGFCESAGALMAQRIRALAANRTRRRAWTRSEDHFPLTCRLVSRMATLAWGLHSSPPALLVPRHPQGTHGPCESTDPMTERHRSQIMRSAESIHPMAFPPSADVDGMLFSNQARHSVGGNRAGRARNGEGLSSRSIVVLGRGLWKAADQAAGSLAHTSVTSHKANGERRR